MTIFTDYKFFLIEDLEAQRAPEWYKILRDKGTTVEETSAKKAALCCGLKEQKLRKKSRGRRETRRISHGVCTYSRLPMKIYANAHIHPTNRNNRDKKKI